MIFPSKEARAITDGRKTQCRLLLNKTKPKVGHEYPIQPQDKDRIVRESIGRLKVLDVQESRLGDITYQEARAEGHKGTGYWKAAYVRHHDRRWLEALEQHTGEVDEPVLVARFDARHAHKPCWVVTLQRVVDIPRFMADQRVKTTGDGQYTPTPARSIDPTAECVDELYQERLSKKATEEGAKQRASFRRDLERDRAQRNGTEPEGLTNRALRHINEAYERRNRAA